MRAPGTGIATFGGETEHMTRPLPPSPRRPALLRAPLSSGGFRPLEPGFLEWVSRKNAPPVRPMLYLPLPPGIQVDDEIDPPPPPDRRR
jgi:hypothetical protein